jgi:PAS domain S-box-containing protein
LLHALNTAAAWLQRSAHSEADVFRAFREQIAGLGLRGVISLLDEEGEHLVIRAVAYPSQTLAMLERLTELKAEGFEFSVVGVDIYRQVVETGKPVFVPDSMAVIAQLLPEVARPFVGHIPESLGASPGIFAPLVVEGYVQGVLAVDDAGGLTAEDVPAVEAFANHLSVALENAHLFAAVQQAEEQYRRLFESASDGILVIDPVTFRILSANRKATEMSGYSEAELLAMPVTALFPPEMAETTLGCLETVQDQGQGVFELPLSRRDGPVLVIQISATMFEANGRLLMQSVLRDVTERKQAEEALARERDLLYILMDNIPDRIYFKDVYSRFTRVNRAQAQALGVKDPAEVVGKTDFDFFGIELARDFYADEQEIVKSGRPLIDKVEGVKEPNGQFRWVSATKVPILDKDGRVTGIVGISRDITERKRIEDEGARLLEAVSQQREQLRALAGRLAEAQEAERKQLAQELHDQVGRNLTALDLNLNIIRAQMPSVSPIAAEIQTRLDETLVLVRQTAESIRNVMANLRPPVLDDYGLLAALRWYGTKFASWAGLPVTVQGEEPIPRLAASVENALFRIAQEALTNVAKHARATKVTVRVEADNGTIRLVVVDNGVGFEPPLPTELAERHGWGLMIMHERARVVGGRCRIESRPGQGTRVIVEVAR